MENKQTTETTETPEEREKLLGQLHPKSRQLIERILAHHPELTAAEAIEHTREMGGI